MTLAEVEIVRRTELDGDRVVITARRVKATLTRPYATFAVTDTNRYAQRLADFATEAAALHAHDRLVRLFDGKML